MSKRTHNVQTPGEVPTTTQDDESSATGATQPGDDQTPAAATAPAEPAATPAAEQPKAAPRGKAPKTRAEYATTPAADIDPAAITAPVLSRDGWVIPLPKV